MRALNEYANREINDVNNFDLQAQILHELQ